MGSSESSPRHPLPPPGCSRSAYGTQMGAYGPVRLRRKSAMETTAAPILPMGEGGGAFRSRRLAARACCRVTQTQRGADGPTDGVRLPRSGHLRADAEQQPSAARLSKPPGRSNTFSAAATARARPAASYVDWAAARLGRERRRDEQPLGCSGWSAEAAARAAHHAGRQYLPGAAMR